ncbi:Membrane protein involved in the export of O-antigen and teichoic acid [Candidatus Kryptonium thompsonii]|jgi:O-antigen/teichoic acid export membrane protein|uniref:Membrane protein involved in the export of O-antigen and teichoic acid n=1 Tax=Candidatus Kryptonium thompsonii TaxID=1633631 RepID=A0A0P1MWU3_9BACT|nr:oligosaccharide flippase family protein [Candidatus Kryptonium thompsoni]CUS76703.1 Membrane protein involved in the export of O-antigen and teichoic acid [Candidatus Kryptonium thompsoni]CUS76901.1 Membrane protein involved in the export of O-antigen and teichoic acid [Candidatus Kryptonium thompsoni]CUS83878.1 Membrane protein involved in the export of O-antigen and teichoic acid [Candidatus Kryptonium thompsoni]CUS84152.1 Membrane protein involved in the export of O-antigen and teichoic a
MLIKNYILPKIVLRQLSKPLSGRVASLDFDLVLTVATNIVFMGLTLISGILLARVLGANGRGELVAIQIWPMLLATFGHLGMPEAATYFVGREPRAAGTIFVLVLLIALISVFPFLLLSYFLLPVFLNAQRYEIIRAAQIFLLYVPLSFFVAISSQVLQGLQEFRLWNLMRLFNALSVFSGTLLGILYARVNKPSAEVISYFILAVSGGLACLFGYLALRRISGPFTLEVGRLRNMVRYGIFSVLSNGPRQLNLRLDQLLMANMLSSTALGLYAVAASWAYGLSPIIWAVGGVAFPRISALPEELQLQMVKKILRQAVLMAALLGIIQLSITPLGISLLFGSEFVSATWVALILVCAAMVSSVNGVLGYCLHGLGRPQNVLYAELIGLVITVLGLSVLLPRFGIMGAALVSLISYTSTLLVLLFQLSYIKGWCGETSMPGTRYRIVNNRK